MADCDGMIICNSASAEMASVIKTCEDNEMYVAQFFRVIDPEANPDEYAQACASPYYVGAVHESEYDNGFTLVTILGEKGCRKIGLEGWEPGDATFLGRWAGYQAGVEAWNEAHADDPMEMLEPQYGRTTTDTGRQAAEAIIDANPDIDALIVAGGGGDTLLGAIAGIEAKGLTGKIAVVSTDFLPDLDVKLETGAMAAESGGHYADPFFAFLMVYNAIKGNYEVSTDGFYDMVFPYMFVDSPESYAAYAEYFTGEELPYNQGGDGCTCPDERGKMILVGYPLAQKHRDKQRCQGKVDPLKVERQHRSRQGAQCRSGDPVEMVQQRQPETVGEASLLSGTNQGIGLVRQSEDQIGFAPSGVPVAVQHGDAVKEMPGVDKQRGERRGEDPGSGGHEPDAGELHGPRIDEYAHAQGPSQAVAPEPQQNAESRPQHQITGHHGETVAEHTAPFVSFFHGASPPSG